MSERRSVHVPASEVHERLAGHLLIDGYRLVLDVERSHGSWLVDARDGREYLDLYTLLRLGAARRQPAGHRRRPGVHGAARPGWRPASRPTRTCTPTHLAEFVETFARVLGDPALPHLFFVEGGALAVENALKTAFDWKSRRNEAAGRSRASRHQGDAPDPRVPRPVRLHDVADQHRPDQDRPVPDVRLAADRRPRHHLPARDAPRRRRGRRGARPGPGAGGVRGEPARHRVLHRRADPG